MTITYVGRSAILPDLSFCGNTVLPTNLAGGAGIAADAVPHLSHYVAAAQGRHQ